MGDQYEHYDCWRNPCAVCKGAQAHEELQQLKQDH